MPFDQREAGGRYLDLDAWPRAGAFEFFRHYEQPFTNVCAPVDVAPTLRFCRERNLSFFLASWFLFLRATDDIAPMRYRLREEQVWVHDRLFLGTTIAAAERTFRFCYFPRAEGFTQFHRLGKHAIAAARDGTERLVDLPERDDLIHGTVLPWTAFTSVAHARRAPVRDSIPKIVFGKYEERGETVPMPVSIEVHHALVDGIDIADCLRSFERRLGEPEAALEG